MAKKDLMQGMAKGLGSLLQPTTATQTVEPTKEQPRETAAPKKQTKQTQQPEPQPLVAAGVRKSKGGRKARIKEHTENVRAGLQDGYTRATIIVKAEYIDKLKEIAYRDRSTLKDTIELALADFLAEYEKEYGKIEL